MKKVSRSKALGLKKKKQPSLTQLKKKIWKLCKELVRYRDGDTCQACGAKGLTGANAHTSHLHASSICGGYLRYDLRNLYLCCFRCNISLSGNIAELYRNIERKNGKAFMEELYQDRQKSIQLDRIFLSNKIDEYKAILESY